MRNAGCQDFGKYVCFCESAFILFKPRIAGDDCRNRSVSHRSHESAVEREELERINVFVELERHCGLGDAADAVYGAGVHKPLYGGFKFLGASTVLDGAVDEFSVLLGELRYDRAPDEIYARGFPDGRMLGDVVLVCIDNGGLNAADIGERSPLRKRKDRFRHSACEEIAPKTLDERFPHRVYRRPVA